VRSLTSSLIAAKNVADGRTAWGHLIDIFLPNSVARFTSFVETMTYAGNVYMPVPLKVSDEEQASDGSLPQMGVTVANLGGLAYKFATEQDLTGRNVTIRVINTESSSGDETKITLQVKGALFADDYGTFELGFPFSLEAEGPTRTYSRRAFPGLPFQHTNYFII
jgi:hypothetical protein